VPQIAHTIQIVLAQSGYVWADGYYDSAGGAYVFGGARSDMESGDPAVPAGQFSAMRVAVGHDQLGNPNNDGAFVEINVIKLAKRFVCHRKTSDPSGLVARILATWADRFDGV
jgi:hypothetical protein